MSTPPDQPHDLGTEATARIASILAAAQREVSQTVEAAQRSAKDDLARTEVRTRILDERTVELDNRESDLESREHQVESRAVELDGRATELDLRATELADLTAGLLSTAVEVQTYARRLAALRPLTADAPSLDAIAPEVPRFDVPSTPADARTGGATPAPATEDPWAVRPRTAAPPASPKAEDAPRPSTPAALRAVDPTQDDDRWDRPNRVAATPPAAATPSPQAPPAPPAPADVGVAATAPESPEQVADAPKSEVAAPTADAEAPADPAPKRGAEESQHLSVAPEIAVDDDEELPIVAGSETAKDAPEKLDSARLVALSMAAEGRSRDEVETHVRDTLGIIEHAALIDYVFGDSTPSSVVPSWPPRRRRRP